MPYCRQCGSMVKDGDKYCPICGCSVDPLTNNNPTIVQKQENQGTPAWFIVGFFFPLIGIIAWIALSRSKPVSSKYAGLGVIAPIVIAMICIVILALLPSTDDGHYEYTITEVDSYEDDYYVYYPDDGMIFVEVDVTIYPDTSGAFYPDDFRLICDGDHYKCDAYSDYSLWISDGESDYFILIFEIPSSYSELHLNYVGSKDLTDNTN